MNKPISVFDRTTSRKPSLIDIPLGEWIRLVLFAVASTLLSVAIMTAISKRETVRVSNQVQERYILIDKGKVGLLE